MTARRRNKTFKMKVLEAWRYFLTIIRAFIQLGSFFLVPILLIRLWYSVIISEPPLNMIAWSITLIVVVLVNRICNE